MMRRTYSTALDWLACILVSSGTASIFVVIGLLLCAIPLGLLAIIQYLGSLPTYLASLDSDSAGFGLAQAGLAVLGAVEGLSALLRPIWQLVYSTLFIVWLAQGVILFSLLAVVTELFPDQEGAEALAADYLAALRLADYDRAVSCFVASGSDAAAPTLARDRERLVRLRERLGGSREYRLVGRRLSLRVIGGTHLFPQRLYLVYRATYPAGTTEETIEVVMLDEDESPPLAILHHHVRILPPDTTAWR